MPIISVEDAVRWIRETKEVSFSVKFIKRSTGELRVMTCQYGRKSDKGGKPAYDAAAKGLIAVWDMEKCEYRSIPTEGLREVEISGVWHEVRCA